MNLLVILLFFVCGATADALNRLPDKFEQVSAEVEKVENLLKTDDPGEDYATGILH